MRMVLSLLPALVVVGAVSAQDAARITIQRAIAAHGGAEKLAAVRADRVQFKGTLHVGSSAVPFTDEVTIQLPGQFKSVVQLRESDGTHTLVHILNGETASIFLDGHAQPVSSSNLTQMRQTLQLAHALKLVPLLTDPVFTIQPLGEFRYNGRILVGVRVAGRSQRDVRLFFDKETALLVKSEHLLDGVGGKDVRQEAFYSDYRDVGGYRRPGRVTAYRDGKKIMETELVGAARLDHLDASIFTRP
jgi:hypothetical protein